MPEANLVWVGPDVFQVQAGKREEASVGAVEFFELCIHVQVVLFLEPGIEIGLEDGLLGLVSQILDEPCVVEPVEDFLADVLQGGEVRIQQDDPYAVPVGKVSDDIDEPEVGEHGQKANAPGLLHGLVWPGPTQ